MADTERKTGRKKLGENAYPEDKIEVVRKNNLPNALAFNNRRRGKLPKYFYIDKILYRKMNINTPQDLITLWRVEDAKYITFPYTETRKKAKPAFYTPEVVAMLNRHRVTIIDKMYEGAFPKADRGWPLNLPVEKRDPKNTTARLLWSEEHVLAARDFFANQSGHHRKNKEIVETPVLTLPNRREVLALIKNQQVYYAKTKDGEFVPLWKAPDF